MSRRHLALAFPALALVGTFVASRAGAQAPAPAAEEKPIDFEPIPAPEDKPKVPGLADWQSATPVKLTAKGPRAKNCRMLRVRDWLKVRCEDRTTAVSLLGGKTDGAFFWLPQAKEGEPAPANAEVMFPIKSGDRRVFELFSYGPAYGGSMISPGLVLQEHWVAGEPAPIVIIR
jgi:hypothetical protein